MTELIQKDPESAIVGAFLGWKYVPTGAERAAWDIKELDFNANRKRGTVPIRLDRPWQGSAQVQDVRTVAPNDPERLAAIERLKAH